MGEELSEAIDRALAGCEAKAAKLVSAHTLRAWVMRAEKLEQRLANLEAALYKLPALLAEREQTDDE